MRAETNERDEHPTGNVPAVRHLLVNGAVASALRVGSADTGDERYEADIKMGQHGVFFWDAAITASGGWISVAFRAG
ncbi:MULTISPECIES: hypothetical protein [Brevibacterium]|uniref:Uncharacterized protein n=1 Tax=Brevibacterium aurantiacum TaxID=273384 RepID=A0A2A3ZKZ8_BREAU|nr:MULTISPECIES: hypothetical protein [Brevibacterium]MCI4012410.1 hypothetical protein [Brevibacterium sp. ZH18]PCC52652.1 hypothetical protein CIK59_16310 [Brevibacterium aurantiacum]RCS98056.1 hypothetical protein CIK60_11310 [Brevibacterium aurantiacum]WCE41876.1 hypothetical protein PGC08_09525 [Brevibacterium sp. BDJS002]